jgi:hypothetical protein
MCLSYEVTMYKYIYHKCVKMTTVYSETSLLCMYGLSVREIMAPNALALLETRYCISDLLYPSLSVSDGCLIFTTFRYLNFLLINSSIRLLIIKVTVVLWYILHMRSLFITFCWDSPPFICRISSHEVWLGLSALHLQDLWSSRFAETLRLSSTSERR